MNDFLSNFKLKSKFILLGLAGLLPVFVAIILLSGHFQLATAHWLFLGVTNLGWISLLISFYTSLKTLLKKLLHAQANLAQGDLSMRIESSGQDEFALVMSGFNDMSRAIERRITSVQSSIKEVTYAADQLNTGASNVADAIDQQRKNTTLIAAAIEQMSASILNVAQQCRVAEVSSSTTQQLSTNGHHSVKLFISDLEKLFQEIIDLTQLMQNLEHHSQQVSSISEVIKNISDQTNLLALNAAIEAARAGEYGRGFAVVADEVRTLATRVRNSAEEITATTKMVKEQIHLAAQSISITQIKTEEGINKALEVEGSLREIEQYASQTLDNISVIVNATEQQSKVSIEIGRNIETITQHVEENGKAAQESASIARHLAKLSQVVVH
jgi:methyl-accepting chemotaxis protein